MAAGVSAVVTALAGADAASAGVAAVAASAEVFGEGGSAVAEGFGEASTVVAVVSGEASTAVAVVSGEALEAAAGLDVAGAVVGDAAAGVGDSALTGAGRIGATAAMAAITIHTMSRTAIPTMVPAVTDTGDHRPTTTVHLSASVLRAEASAASKAVEDLGAAEDL